MKSPTPARLAVVIAGAIALILLTLGFERVAWRQFGWLRTELTRELASDGRTGDRLMEACLEMRLAAEPERPVASEKFQAVLQGGLQQNVSAEELPLFQEIQAKARAYEAEENDKYSRTGPGVAVRSDSSVYGELLRAVQRLQASEASTSKARRASASARLEQLQRVFFIVLSGMAVNAGVLLWIAYRRLTRKPGVVMPEARRLTERQEKLASLGVFATGIAHEIRNPLTAIKVRIFSLKGTQALGSADQEDLEVIENEINRLERIVQEFLRFARPAEPELLMVPIDSFLREVYELLLPELEERGLHFELLAQANDDVRIDPEKMKQVLLNFIHNAADAIEGEGTITLRSKCERRTVDRQALYAVVIDVTDTGKGMSTEVQQRLFDPFFTTKEKGTGLGLPIAARIVEKHGGLIQYETKLGEGTTFSILLPRPNS